VNEVLAGEERLSSEELAEDAAGTPNVHRARGRGGARRGGAGRRQG
jgi:hypothetical protein